MSTKTFRSQLIPVTIAVAALASVSVPTAAANTGRDGAHAVRAQRAAHVTALRVPMATPGPRMI